MHNFLLESRVFIIIKDDYGFELDDQLIWHAVVWFLKNFLLQKYFQYTLGNLFSWFSFQERSQNFRLITM